MSTFGGLVLTDRGRNLQAKAQTGVTLNYTRIALGDGNLGATPINGLNSLINQKQSLNISKIRVMSGGRAVVGTILTNQSLTEGFYFREIGVFATDPDLGEILYCYGNAGALAEYIPPGNGSDVIEKIIDVQILVGNAQNVTATIDESLVYASVEQLNIHQADYVKHPGFAVATGTANNYTVTLSPAPKSYDNGMGIIVAINVDATGASTLNVNNLGAIPIKKANGNNVTNLKANGIYTLRYSTGNFILQGEGGSGNAQPSEVLTGKTFSNDAGDQVGSMPNIGAQIITPGTSAKTIVKGYHNGNGYVIGDADLIASNIRSGINIFGVYGTLQPGRSANGNLTTATNGRIEVSNLTFRPDVVIVFHSKDDMIHNIYDGRHASKVYTRSNWYNVGSTYAINSNGFSFSGSSNTEYTWYAYKV